jgi:hypothetical protein
MPAGGHLQTKQSTMSLLNTTLQIGMQAAGMATVIK